jgi:Na+-driven multidrug efflux pump
MRGQNLGAGNLNSAKEISLKAAASVFSLLVLGILLVYPLRIGIVRAFTEDASIIGETDKFLQYLLPTLPFFGLFMIGMSAGRGSGRTLAPTIIGIFRLWVVRIGLGYFLSLSMGVMGIWISISLSNLLAGVAALIWLIYGNWNRPVIRRGEFEVSTT